MEFYDAFATVKSRTVSELFDFLVEKSNKAEGVELFKITRTMAEVALAIYDFAEYVETGD